MKELLKQLSKLEIISNQLEIPDSEREACIQQAGNYLNNFIEKLPKTKTYSAGLGTKDALAIDLKKNLWKKFSPFIKPKL